jgi:hypothetical protein
MNTLFFKPLRNLVSALPRAVVGIVDCNLATLFLKKVEYVSFAAVLYLPTQRLRLKSLFA